MIVTVIAMGIAAEAGWAVGATDDGIGAVDKELLTDSRGNPWIPVSSLAGSLRDHLFADDADESLMGSRSGAEELLPSRLWLLGAQIRAAGKDEPPATQVLASTAIDPRRKGALPRSLRHKRVVNEPTDIELYAMCEGLLSEEHWDLLAGWQPSVGGDRSTGGGRARLERLAYRIYDLDRDDDLREWLTRGGPDRYTDLIQVEVHPVAEHPVLDVRFRIVDGLHIGTGSRQEKTAITLRRDGTPLIPGKTWKGLFRARAGYILRTLRGEQSACTDQQGCGSCPLCDLFGSTRSRGRVVFVDSAIDKATSAPRTHVAIDRVTGGARDQLLFTQEVIGQGETNLRILQLAPIEDWQRNLLRHVIKDLDDGLIGVGAGSQRGQGTLRLISPLPPLEPVVVP
ncbi:RAMP superfamily CRISPR-associated protein [Microbispora rosea]|uniref:RAMP superfamily CRISPR-associated protein n=1 Tax=Microbispora rosea TaxID=58117 RepID=UPI0036B96209